MHLLNIYNYSMPYSFISVAIVSFVLLDEYSYDTLQKILMHLGSPSRQYLERSNLLLNIYPGSLPDTWRILNSVAPPTPGFWIREWGLVITVTHLLHWVPWAEQFKIIIRGVPRTTTLSQDLVGVLSYRWGMGALRFQMMHPIPPRW